MPRLVHASMQQETFEPYRRRVVAQAGGKEPSPALAALPLEGVIAMACNCGGFCGAADAQFSRERAEKELRKYHRKGPKSTTRLLRDGLERAGLVQEASLIEVGAGIASLTFELLFGTEFATGW